MTPFYMNLALLARRMDDSRGGGGFGLFLVLVIAGIIVFLVLRGRRDRAERVGEPIRPMASGPLQGHSFACPFAKCPSCGAAGDRMKQDWDGMRKVTWTCGYCGAVAGVQELKDEELPPGARRRLGLDQEGEAAQLGPGQQGYYPPQGGGGGMGGLLTGMMIGSMMGGGHRQYQDQDGWTRSGEDGSSASNNDWGEGGGSGGDWGDSGGGGDWGDSGGGGGDWGDSGGGDNF